MRCCSQGAHFVWLLGDESCVSYGSRRQSCLRVEILGVAEVLLCLGHLLCSHHLCLVSADCVVAGVASLVIKQQTSAALSTDLRIQSVWHIFRVALS